MCLITQKGTDVHCGVCKQSWPANPQQGPMSWTCRMVERRQTPRIERSATAPDRPEFDARMFVRARLGQLGLVFDKLSIERMERIASDAYLEGLKARK